MVFNLRINDMKPMQYDHTAASKRAVTSQNSTSSASMANPTEGPSRADRLDALKQNFSQGKSVDLSKLADKMLGVGNLFNEKA